MTDNYSGISNNEQTQLQEKMPVNPEERLESEYIGTDTHLPSYLPYPRFLLKTKITQTAKLLYALLLDRTTLSQKNRWQDEYGRTYIIFPVTAIADSLEKSPSTIKEALNGRNAYIENLCSFSLLILDDFGMERGTEYGLEQVYNVIDSRYRSRKPLIVTTNLTLSELQNPTDRAHQRIYDRVLAMCIPICCSGVNFRKEQAQKNMKDLKEMLK